MTLSTDDARLLEYYVQRGHGPWNLSLDAAWLDYELRRYVSEQLRAFGGAAHPGTSATREKRGIVVDDGVGHSRILETCDRVVRGRPLRLCNVGIGVGLWDDWLGYVVGAEITSVDRDREICEVFALRQRRERHPYPARVICGDVLLGALNGEVLDVITCIGSTLHESGAPDELRRGLTAALAPTGRLIIAEVRENAGTPGVALTCTSTGRDGRSMDQS